MTKLTAWPVWAGATLFLIPAAGCPGAEAPPFGSTTGPPPGGSAGSTTTGDEGGTDGDTSDGEADTGAPAGTGPGTTGGSDSETEGSSTGEGTGGTGTGAGTTGGGTTGGETTSGETTRGTTAGTTGGTTGAMTSGSGSSSGTTGYDSTTGTTGEDTTGTTGGDTTGTTGGETTGTTGDDSETGTTGGGTTGTTGGPECGNGVPEMDEDCDDGNANDVDGCTSACLVGPIDLAFTNPADTVLRGNASGGTRYDDDCPSGQVLVGFNGYVNGAVSAIEAVCGTPSLAGSIDVVVGAGSTLTQRGTATGSTWSTTCGANQMVVGFTGRSGGLIDQIVLRCAPLEISETGGVFSVSIGTVTDLAPVGGTGGSPFAATDCAPGSVATAANIRAGDSVDALGLGCNLVSLVFP